MLNLLNEGVCQYADLNYFKLLHTPPYILLGHQHEDAIIKQGNNQLHIYIHAKLASKNPG